ncbi:MAG: primosomal protein N' [Alphaproteobacteria bacterium]
MANPQPTSDLISPTAKPRVKVLLPLPLADAYDYGVPEQLSLVPGDFVEVPLGARRAIGVVWSIVEEGADPAISESRLKDVARRLNAPPMPAENRRLVDWVAGYTVAPRGAVLRMAMSVPEALEPPKPRIAFIAAPKPPVFRMTPARQRVLSLLGTGPPRSSADIVHETGVSPGVVTGLHKAGAIVPVPLSATAAERAPDPETPGPALSPAQAGAVSALRESGNVFSVTLLDGVTGSGKTEVYFEAIADTLRQGKQALVLLPEIALGAQWLARFETRFGAPPTGWHSDLTQARRRETWRAVANGQAQVVVGARSALFLPFTNLGLIIVDEEHEPAFKQEDGVCYHARDMAVVRAQIGGIPIILASATPSLETVTNVEAGRYRRLHLPDRHGGARLPAISLVDLRRDPPERQSWISQPLRRALAENLAAGEQALLFLNRRGYAPLTLCRKCGHRLECPNCTAWLVEHRFSGRLQCHHCGFSGPRPGECSDCGAADSFVACGPGVERLAEEVMHFLPDARFIVVTSDSIHRPSDADAFVRQVMDHEVDIVIGTQIVAKGHHFPKLTLVGVVDADLGLAGGDLRAAERTYQMLHQVAGRAGRAELAGHVLLQTYNPESPVLQALAAGDRDGFLAAEADMRETGGWPPFGRLAALIVSGRDAGLVERVARDLARTAPGGNGIRMLGPAPAPMALLRGRHRWRLLLKAARNVPVQDRLRHWLKQIKAPNAVRIQVDVDPYSFM